MRRLLLVITAAALSATLLAVAAARAGGHFTLRGPVVHVVDGDTIDVRVGSRTERVRVLGIDTPERGACYADRAAAETTRLALEARVVLRGDRTQATRDRYGRLLAYVQLPSRADLGRGLLEGGFAHVLVVGRPFQRVSSYRGYERAARSAGRGLWSACSARATPPPPAPTVRCHASYPDFCIPPPPPDLDCRHLAQRHFRVRWDVADPDPHRFDADHNGFGCES
jgi:endonuclease YncB( thermonuclease family)